MGLGLVVLHSRWNSRWNSQSVESPQEFGGARDLDSGYALGFYRSS
jgi:hypothetical protein